MHNLHIHAVVPEHPKSGIKEKGCIVCTAVDVFHVWCISMASKNAFNERLADIPASLCGTPVIQNNYFSSFRCARRSLR